MLELEVETEIQLKNFDLYLYFSDAEKFYIEKERFRLKPDFEGYINIIKADGIHEKVVVGGVVISSMRVRWQEDDLGELLEIDWYNFEIEPDKLLFSVEYLITQGVIPKDIKGKASKFAFNAQYEKPKGSEKWRLNFLDKL